MSGIKKAADVFGRYFFIFLISAVIGWLYEEFCDVVVMGTGWYNRGFLWGPYLPIYGTLSLVIWLLFVAIVVLGAYGIGYDARQFIYNQF